jgi:hypothetical protein
MSHAALSLANNDVEALLDPNMLSITAGSGSFGFQPINAFLPWDLGAILDTTNYYCSSYQDQNSSQITNRTAGCATYCSMFVSIYFGIPCGDYDMGARMAQAIFQGLTATWIVWQAYWDLYMEVRNYCNG